MLKLNSLLCSTLARQLATSIPTVGKMKRTDIQKTNGVFVVMKIKATAPSPGQGTYINKQ